MRTILVVLELHYTSGRDFLTGIFRYQHTVHDWNLQLVQNVDQFTEATIADAERDGITGIITTRPGNAATVRALANTFIPTVAVNLNHPFLQLRRHAVAFVWNDNADIGTLGAQHLLSRGRFNSFAFVPREDDIEWSRLRERAFAEQLRIKHITPRVFARPQCTSAAENLPALAEWIGGLPKPTAVMAATDRLALQVLSACKKIGLKVPQQVAILGVDNDELICSHASPPLSSILPGHEQMGYVAARELDRLIRGKAMRGKTPCNQFIIRATGVIERESTTPIAPSAALVRAADDFIRANVRSGIAVKDVVRHLGVSRRLAELRYREVKGTTLHDAIERARLNHVCELLVSTRRKFTLIATECGFRSLSSLSHLFRHRYGQTMRDYRQLHRAGRNSTR